MARIARIVLPRRPHLVCQVGSDAIFDTTRRRQAYQDILAGAAEVYRVRVLAWSILPEQVVLVAVPPKADSLGAFMRVAQTRFARFLHSDGYQGKVTPRRFASCPLDNQAALDAIKYVEALPVVEGEAPRPWDYTYCSAAWRNGQANGLLSVLPSITGDIRSWKVWHRKALKADRLAYLLMRMRTGKPAGEASFVRRVERKVGMNLSRPRGRPKGTRKKKR